jgi:hypothetical protein
MLAWHSDFKPTFAELMSRLLRIAVLLCLAVQISPGTTLGKDEPVTYKIPLPAKPDYSALKWLVGEWTGQAIAGKNTQGDVKLSLAYDLDERFMVLRETVSLSATANAPALQESTLGLLSPDSAQNSFALRVFSSTGYVIRYQVIAGGDRVEFNQAGGDNPPTGWLFRRILDRVDNDNCILTVQVAPPATPFFDYYTVKLTRGGASKPTAPPGQN